VANQEGLLLPGMTATIDFLVGQAKDVLRVANAALRIKPNAEMMAVLKKQFEERMKGMAGGAPGQPQAGGRAFPMGAGGFPGLGRPGNGSGKRPKDVALLWFLDAAGKLKAARVRTGISDGQMTEIRSDEIKEGMEVIKTVILSTAEQAAQGPPRMRIL
jgi:HlyD family secretion protein